jgi:hypothetical protein
METREMTKRAATIRADLYELVMARLFEKGVDNLLDFNRKYATPKNMHPAVFDEPLCPFVNCLCPDDLCWLPAGHVGADDGYHITGTVAFDYALKWSYGKTDMAPVGTSRHDLIQRGAKLMRERFPDDG